jgi:tRNA(fMet)-specific endonuclease VapC
LVKRSTTATTSVPVRLCPTPIGPLDAQIGAHALSLGAVLVTNNVREFRRIPGLKVEDWIS